MKGDSPMDFEDSNPFALMRKAFVNLVKKYNLKRGNFE